MSAEELQYPSYVNELMCWHCGHRWYGRVPSFVLLRDIYCPKCDEKSGVFATGQPIDITEE